MVRDEAKLKGYLTLVAEDLGKSPSKNEFDAYVKDHPDLNLPCSQTIQSYFGSWNKAKKEAGLSRMSYGGRSQEYSEEDMYISLLYASEQLEKSPNTEEYNGFKKDHPELKMPSASTIQNKIGWRDAKKQLGIKKPVLSKQKSPSIKRQYSEEDVFISLVYVSDQIGHAPLAEEYENFRKGHRELAIPGIWIIRGGVGFQNAKDMLGFEKSKMRSRDKKYSEDDMFIAVKYVADQLDKPPSANVYKKFRLDHKELDMPSLGYIKDNIGWDNIKEMLGYETLKGFGYTDEKALSSLLFVANAIGESPTTLKYETFRKEHKDLDICYHATIVKKFGTWNKAKKAAGLEQNKSWARKRILDDVVVDSIMRVYQKLKHIPSITEYGYMSKNNPDMNLASRAVLISRPEVWTETIDTIKNIEKDKIMKDVFEHGIPSELAYDSIRRENSYLEIPDYETAVEQYCKTTGMEIDAAEIIKRQETARQKLNTGRRWRGVKYSDDDLINSIISYVDKFELFPTVSDYQPFADDNGGYRPSCATIINRFGTWNRAKEIAYLKIKNGEKVIYSQEVRPLITAKFSSDDNPDKPVVVAKLPLEENIEKQIIQMISEGRSVREMEDGTGLVYSELYPIYNKLIKGGKVKRVKNGKYVLNQNGLE